MGSFKLLFLNSNRVELVHGYRGHINLEVVNLRLILADLM